MDISTLLRSTLYFLALINPASKILLLSSRQPPYSWRELRVISIRSTFIALMILLVLSTAGNFLLDVVFHVEIYSLRIAGGITLFLVGLNAVRHGRFHEESMLQGGTDITVVPLAAPLIAGPGTIAAALAFAPVHGLWTTLLCLAMALLLNLLIMLTSLQVGRALERVHATGPLIRITGLIVMAVAVQMILSGFADWTGEIIAKRAG
jgi:multiple antibiotic resistance protein